MLEENKKIVSDKSLLFAANEPKEYYLKIAENSEEYLKIWVKEPTWLQVEAAMASVMKVNPKTGDIIDVTFDLTECKFKDIPDDLSSNSFEFELPVSKKKIGFKVLTGKDEDDISIELKRINKINKGASPEISTSLRYMMSSVDGDSTPETINSFSQNILARDSLALRKEIKRVSPDIDMTQEIEMGGELVKVVIPMTTNFFWPKSEL